MSARLAIIIPSYRATYLRQALDSLVAQTCQDFKVYIGDDCSPQDLEAIIAPYKQWLDISYIRFDSNLGSKDLIAQWERCVALSKTEDWFWLFSDDDVMEPQCVELFYHSLKEQPEAKLFHFDVTVIEGNGQKTNDPHYIKEDFPTYLSANDFLRKRLTYSINSYIVEYVVRRDLFVQSGGYVRYPLAWCSDDATWHRLAKAAGGITTIKGARVLWRKSDSNITPDRSKNVQRQKLKAVGQHLRYCYSQLGITSLPAIIRYYLHAIYQARSIFGL